MIKEGYTVEQRPDEVAAGLDCEHYFELGTRTLAQRVLGPVATRLLIARERFMGPRRPNEEFLDEQQGLYDRPLPPTHDEVVAANIANVQGVNSEELLRTA